MHDLLEARYHLLHAADTEAAEQVTWQFTGLLNSTAGDLGLGDAITSLLDQTGSEGGSTD